MTSAGLLDNAFVLTTRSECDWDTSRYTILMKQVEGTTSNYPNIDHPLTGYQRQYIHFYIDVGNLKKAEEDVWSSKLYFIFKQPDDTNVLYVSYVFKNDATNDEFDVDVIVHSYLQATSGASVTYSFERDTNLIFVEITLDYGDAATDYVTLNTRCSPVPYFPTGISSAFHAAQSTGSGSLEIKQLLVQNYMYDIDPGHKYKVSSPFISPVSRDASEANLVDYNFPLNIGDYGDWYYYGDAANVFRKHLGPLMDLPFEYFQHQTLDGMRIADEITQDKLGDESDAENETGTVFARIKYLVARLKKIYESDTSVGFIGLIVDIIQLVEDIFDGNGVDWATHIGDIKDDVAVMFSFANLRAMLGETFTHLNSTFSYGDSVQVTGFMKLMTHWLHVSLTDLTNWFKGAIQNDS